MVGYRSPALPSSRTGQEIVAQVGEQMERGWNQARKHVFYNFYLLVLELPKGHAAKLQF